MDTVTTIAGGPTTGLAGTDTGQIKSYLNLLSDGEKLSGGLSLNRGV